MLEKIGAVNLLLCLERVENRPRTRKACGKVPYGLRKVQCVQRKVRLRELPLPKPGSKNINWVISAGDIFSEVELRQ